MVKRKDTQLKLYREKIKFLKKQNENKDMKLAKYKSLGAPKLKDKDIRDLMIIWLMQEQITLQGNSIRKSAEEVYKSDELKALLKKYPNLDEDENVKPLSYQAIRNIYTLFKSSYDPAKVFEIDFITKKDQVEGSERLLMLPLSEW